MWHTRQQLSSEDLHNCRSPTCGLYNRTRLSCIIPNELVPNQWIAGRHYAHHACNMITLHIGSHWILFTKFSALRIFSCIHLYFTAFVAKQSKHALKQPAAG